MTELLSHIFVNDILTNFAALNSRTFVCFLLSVLIEVYRLHALGKRSPNLSLTHLTLVLFVAVQLLGIFHWITSHWWSAIAILPWLPEPNKPSFSKFQICCLWRELWGMGTRSWIVQSSNQLRDLFLKEGIRSFPWNIELTQKLYLLTKLKNWFFVIYWESHVCNRKNNVSLAIIISSSNVAIRRLPPNYRIVECSAALASKV